MVSIDVSPEAGLFVQQIEGFAPTLFGFDGQSAMADSYDPNDPLRFTAPRTVNLPSEAVLDTEMPFAVASAEDIFSVFLLNTGDETLSANITVRYALSANVTTFAPDILAAASTVLDVQGGIIDNPTGALTTVITDESRSVAQDTTGGFDAFPGLLSGDITVSILLATGEVGAVGAQIADVVGIQPIPLPASAWVLILGVGGLMALRRRRA